MNLFIYLFVCLLFYFTPWLYLLIFKSNKKHPQSGILG